LKELLRNTKNRINDNELKEMMTWTILTLKDIIVDVIIDFRKG